MWAPSKKSGFTIVELLIVIVVIGILAAITVVAYNGVQNRARVSVITTSLNQAAKKLALYSVDNGAFPTGLSAAGILDTDMVSYQYTASTTSYCLTATTGTISYKITESNNVSGGGCTGHSDGGVAVTPPMSDNFDSAITTAKWPTFYGGATATGGRLRTPTSSSYPGVISGYVFNMSTHTVHIEFISPPNVGNNTTQNSFRIDNSEGYAVFNIRSGNPNWLIEMQGGSTGITTINRDAVAHRWLRFRVVGGNLLWEASPDKSTWSILRSVTKPTWLDSPVRVQITSGHWGAETAPGYAEWDNFNT